MQWDEKFDLESQVAEKAIRYNIFRQLDLTGMSQNDLIPLLHISKGAVSQLLNGGSRFKFRQVFVLAKALNVTIDDLIDPTYMFEDEKNVPECLDAISKERNRKTNRNTPYCLVFLNKYKSASI